MRARAVVVGSLAALLLVGCGRSPEPSPPPPPTSTAPPPRVELPPRPRDVPIDGVDPCSLLTEAQRRELGLDGRPISSESENTLLGRNPACTISGSEPREIGVGLTLAAGTGIERYTADEVLAEVVPVDVEGFPAVVARPTAMDDFCNVGVDIANGQLVNITYRQGLSDEPIPQDELCEGAARVASAAIQTLLIL